MVVAELQARMLEEVGEVVVREPAHAAAGLVVGELHLAFLEPRHRRRDRLLEDCGLLADDLAREVELGGAEDDRVVAVLHHLHERDVRAGRGLAVLAARDEAEEAVLLDELEKPPLAGAHLDDGGLADHRSAIKSIGGGWGWHGGRPFTCRFPRGRRT